MRDNANTHDKHLNCCSRNGIQNNVSCGIEGIYIRMMATLVIDDIAPTYFVELFSSDLNV